MKKCPNCGKSSPGNSAFCSHCSHKFTNNTNLLSGIFLLFGGSSVAVFSIIAIVIILLFAVSNSGNPPTSTTSPSNTGNSSNNSSNNSPSSSDSANNNPQPSPTRRPTNIPTQNSYWCDDLQYVKLDIGDSAKISWPKVNLRSTPIVPEDYYANIVTELVEGTSLKIIDGPECAHNGTWWKIQTNSGQIGWVRERTSDGYLMKP